MNIVILGAPGSGKGTQAEKIAQKYGLYHLQTGEVARNLAKTDKRIRGIVDSGKLIPEEEMTMYVLDFLHEKKEEYSDILFEGFPRFISQYEALVNFLENKGDDLDLVISLEISKEEAIRRISSRRICKTCGKVYNLITNPPKKEEKCECGGNLIQRKDDNSKSIEVRFEYYKNNTKELIDYVESKDKLVKINGERPIEEIFGDLATEIEKIKKKGK